MHWKHVDESNPDVGSSKNIIGGLLTSSKAIERRFFWPPDKFLVNVRRCSWRPNVSRISFIYKQKIKVYSQTKTKSRRSCCGVGEDNKKKQFSMKRSGQSCWKIKNENLIAGKVFVKSGDKRWCSARTFGLQSVTEHYQHAHTWILPRHPLSAVTLKLVISLFCRESLKWVNGTLPGRIFWRKLFLSAGDWQLENSWDCRPFIAELCEATNSNLTFCACVSETFTSNEMSEQGPTEGHYLFFIFLVMITFPCTIAMWSRDPSYTPIKFRSNAFVNDFQLIHKRKANQWHHTNETIFVPS